MTLPQIPKQTPSLRRIPQTVAPRAIASLTPEEYAQLSDYDTHLLNVACGIRTAHQFIDTHIIPRAQTPLARKLLIAQSERAFAAAERHTFDH